MIAKNDIDWARVISVNGACWYGDCMVYAQSASRLDFSIVSLGIQDIDAGVDCCLGIWWNGDIFDAVKIISSRFVGGTD
eukprot:3097463-Ditylum_brightwellii.AAC.1